MWTYAHLQSLIRNCLPRCNRTQRRARPGRTYVIKEFQLNKLKTRTSHSTYSRSWPLHFSQVSPRPQTQQKAVMTMGKQPSRKSNCLNNITEKAKNCISFVNSICFGAVPRLLLFIYGRTNRIVAVLLPIPTPDPYMCRIGSLKNQSQAHHKTENLNYIYFLFIIK